MPRDRAALTDKEERILVQAQLMGLSTQSMVKIGNRLRALEQERETIALINETCQGYIWEEPDTTGNLKIITPDGHTINAVRGKKGSSHWHRYSWKYDITITKEGTRFKPRQYKDHDLHCDYDWKKRLMPGKSKELYSLIRWVKHSMPYEVHK